MQDKGEKLWVKKVFSYINMQVGRKPDKSVDSESQLKREEINVYALAEAYPQTQKPHLS